MTATYLRYGAGVTAPALSDGTANYTPGVSERRSGSTSFVNADRLGSTTHLTDATEATTDTREYDAYGMTVSSTGSTATPFGFAGAVGYQQDYDSGLMLLGHRYYDASTGRFITRDPAKDGRNWFVYCNNSPLAWVDRTGQLPEWLAKIGSWIWENSKTIGKVVLGIVSLKFIFAFFAALWVAKENGEEREKIRRYIEWGVEHGYLEPVDAERMQKENGLGSLGDAGNVMKTYWKLFTKLRYT